MNKEKLIEKLLDREELEEHGVKNNRDSRLSDLQVCSAIYYQYFERLLDILEEAENHGIKIYDDKLINYLKICEGGKGTTQEDAISDMKRKQKLMATFRETTFIPVKKIADWTEKSVFWQRLEFWFVGILGTVIIGLFSFLLPYIHSLKSPKESVEPIKVQIIEQTIPQSQSEPITSESP